MGDMAAGFRNEFQVMVIEMDGMNANEVGPQQAQCVKAIKRSAFLLPQAFFNFVACFMDMAVNREV